MKRKLIQLASDRTAALNAAEAALNAGNNTEYNSQMEKVANLNSEIATVKAFLEEKEKKLLENAPSGAEARDMAEERGACLMKGQAVNFSTAEVMRGLRNSVTITGTIVQPTGAGSDIKGGDSAISGILEQVTVEDLTGMSAYEAPYVVSETEAAGADITKQSGKARTDSTDPVFAVAQIRPYEVTTTSYVDRNIAKLSPADYYAKVQAMALRALRRKVAALIVNGDGDVSPILYGIKGAKNKAAEDICVTQEIAAIDENTLDELYFAYGADTEMGGAASLLLRKQDLKAIGQLRGTNEKRRLYTITPTGNGNQGTITDGGVVIPYTIVPALSELDLIYGSLLNYTLGLFGGYEVRVSDEVKAVERMHTILGDVAVGGNVTVHHGFVVGKKQAGD